MYLKEMHLVMYFNRIYWWCISRGCNWRCDRGMHWLRPWGGRRWFISRNTNVPVLQPLSASSRRHNHHCYLIYIGNDAIAWLSFKLDTVEKLSSSIFCLWVCQASVSPDQISTFSNIYRHTSPLLTMYHLISSSTNLYWPSTSQYRYILTQYHQVPRINHHLMSHAQYTWSSFHNVLVKK